MRTLFSALAAAGVLLAGAGMAVADDATTTTAPTSTPTTAPTTATTAPTTSTTPPATVTTTPTTSTGEGRGFNDLRLTGLTFAPDRKTYRPGATFTATMTVGNRFLSDFWGIEGTYPKGLTVTGQTNLITVETGPGTVKGYGETWLDEGDTVTVTVTFRADAVTSGPVTFRVFGGKWADDDQGNNTVTRNVAVATTPAPAPDTAEGGLADTGASAMVPLYAGGVLVLLGGGLLAAVRRRAGR